MAAQRHVDLVILFVTALTDNDKRALARLEQEARDIARGDAQARGLDWEDECLYRATTVDGAVDKATRDRRVLCVGQLRPPANVSVIIDPCLPTYDTELARARKLWPGQPKAAADRRA